MRRVVRCPPRVVIKRLWGLVFNRFRAAFVETVGSRFQRVPVAWVQLTVDHLQSLFFSNNVSSLSEWLRGDFAFQRDLQERIRLSMQHKTRLLGADDGYLGEPIKWHRDYATGKVWPKCHFSRIDYLQLADPCDVKRCWDLSRAYHWVWLGQGYWLSGDDRYADEVIRQWMGWLADNPPEIGVNWGNAMEVALRTVSWWWTLTLLANAPQLTEGIFALVLGAIIKHARYIERHLEISASKMNSNHLLADYVGLAFAGMLLPRHPRAEQWRNLGLLGLWSELERQVYPDGVDYEQSTEYHRFVLEFFLYTAILARREGYEPPLTA